MKSKNIKPILGCEIYVCKQDSHIKDKSNSELSHFLLLAKNLLGWRTLINIVSETNKADNFYHKPRISFNRLTEFLDGNIIGFCGHLGSFLSDIVESNKDNYLTEAVSYIDHMKEIFGKDNFFLEAQLIDQHFNKSQSQMTEVMRGLSQRTKTKIIATPDAHYCEKQDAVDQRILLCNNLKTTLIDINKKMLANESIPMECFFRSDNYHIPDMEEMESIHTQEELENTFYVDSMCEEYSILNKPLLPAFECPNNSNPEEYLRQLCRDGWREKIMNDIPESEHTRYADRVKLELDILQKAGLSSYFLIVQDIVNYVKDNSWLPGPGRGCFIPDTNVKMYDGTTKKIYQINIGDIVIDAYGNPQEVYDTLQYDINEDIIELIFENEKTVRCTKDHKFLTKNRGWVEAQYLSDKDDVVEV
jgi:DNA polymerase-3 subunit alpha